MKEFWFLIIGGLFSGVIVYIVKGFFSTQEERVKDTKQDLTKRMDSLEVRLEKLASSQSEILNNVLNKFSSWEDRIKKILDDSFAMLNKNSGTSETIVPEIIKQSIVKSINDLDKSIRMDISEVKGDIDKVNETMKKTQTLLNNMTLCKKDKEAMAKILEMILVLEGKSSSDIIALEKKVSSMFDICKALTSEQRIFEKKINHVVEITKNKIRLVE